MGPQDLSRLQAHSPSVHVAGENPLHGRQRNPGHQDPGGRNQALEAQQKGYGRGRTHHRTGATRPEAV